MCQNWLKLAQWFWRRDFFIISSMYFRYFCNNLPLEMGWVLHLNKLQFPSPKDALCQVWLKLAQWLWRRRFLNFVNVFSLFHYYLPLEKGGPPRIPFTQGYFVPSLVKIDPVVLEKKIFKSCQFIFNNSQLSPLWEGRGPSFEQT